jgi:hypothetical protein
MHNPPGNDYQRQRAGAAIRSYVVILSRSRGTEQAWASEMNNVLFDLRCADDRRSFDGAALLQLARADVIPPAGRSCASLEYQLVTASLVISSGASKSHVT